MTVALGGILQYIFDITLVACGVHIYIYVIDLPYSVVSCLEFYTVASSPPPHTLPPLPPNYLYYHLPFLLCIYIRIVFATYCYQLVIHAMRPTCWCITFQKRTTGLDTTTITYNDLGYWSTIPTATTTTATSTTTTTTTMSSLCSLPNIRGSETTTPHTISAN